MVEKGLLCTTKDPISPITQKITGILGALCQELGTKTEYIFLIIAQYYVFSI